MTLDNTDPKLFAVLVKWLYNTSTLPINFFSKFNLALMAQLWILGNRFLMIKFQNYIAEIIVYKIDVPPKVDEFYPYIKIAGHYAKGDNPLINIAVHKIVCPDTNIFDHWADHLLRRILSMVAVYLKSRFGNLGSTRQPVFGMSDDFLLSTSPQSSVKMGRQDGRRKVVSFTF
jgi:hypothetical protein